VGITLASGAPLRASSVASSWRTVPVGVGIERGAKAPAEERVSADAVRRGEPARRQPAGRAGNPEALPLQGYEGRPMFRCLAGKTASQRIGRPAQIKR